MVDSKTVNGEVENETAQDFYDDNEAKLTELSSKIEALESEKIELGNENKEVKEKIKKLTLEIDELRNNEEEMRLEMDQWEDDMVLESIAARSADLETEVSRLQHDLITSMSEIDEANKEMAELKRGMEEKGFVIEGLEKEIAELKKEKLESEKKERDLERKLGALEVRVMEERSKKVRIEEEMREKMDELKKKVEALEAEVARTKVELVKTNEEKRESEKRALLLQMNMLELKEVVEKKRSQGINGKTREAKGSEGWLNVQIVVVGSAMAVAFAAVVVCIFAIGSDRE